MAKSPTFKGTSKRRPKTRLELTERRAEPISARPPENTLESDNQSLRLRVADLEKELERCQAELSKAAALEVGAETLLAQRFVATELQHGDLASLFVASMRLQSSLNRPDILSAIREIASNLIGVEEMALFEIDRITHRMSLTDGFGSCGDRLSQVRIGEGPIGEVALSGEPFFHDVNGPVLCVDNNGLPKACIPLKVDGEIWGVIAIFRLLPQKNRLVALDYQLLELLSTRAGIALYCAKLAGERLFTAKTTA